MMRHFGFSRRCVLAGLVFGDGGDLQIAVFVVSIGDAFVPAGTVRLLMRIIEIRERSIPVSRYDDPVIASGGLTTSLVAVTTDVMRAGKPVIGYGYASIGRFAQGGLIRERFAPRVLSAAAHDFGDDSGVTLDPFRAWRVMMTGEKPGGHGERCVAVGALDMAIWDAAAKIAGLPLYRFLSDKLGRVVLSGRTAGICFRCTFAPFAGLADGMCVVAGHTDVPQVSGIGFETVPAVWQAFQALH